MLLLIASALLFGQTQTAEITSLDLSQIHQGWGKPMHDRSVTNTPLSVAGNIFDHGLGTHAVSTFKINLFGSATRFHAFCGVDDNAGSDRAAIVFRVVGDGRVLWASPVKRWKAPASEIDVPLQGVKVLTLKADAAADGIDNDHADWCDAAIEFRGTAPKAYVAPPEKAVILTPPSPRTPRINGPSVSGVRPGSPFLYLIPTTGVRPMRFSVRGLPNGLLLDPTTGQISGAVAKRGSFRVMLKASNRLGSATRAFRIVCGDRIALTPQMGWNSWYIWTSRVSDQIMRDAADAMVRTGLTQHGWQYVNIDDCWARVPGSKDPVVGGPTRDSNGKLLPSSKFPDMRALTDYIHSKGLKAGIYTSPGPTTCGGFEGAFGHEALDARTFADWGFDLLKYDWCSYQAEANTLEAFEKPYRMMGSLLKAQHHDIVFNLCQYGMDHVWTWGREVGGNSWRTAGDLGSGFTMFQDGFDLYAREHLERYAAPGSFNDPDYLLLGYIAGPGGTERKTPFTPNEQYTQVSMWSLLAAPLILSGDITRLDPFTLSLLTNDEILAVDQDSLVKAARRIRKDGDAEVWARPLEDGGMAVGLFNTGDDDTLPFKLAWADLGIRGRYLVRDLWRQKNLGTRTGSFAVSVRRHGVIMLKLTAAPVGR